MDCSLNHKSAQLGVWEGREKLLTHSALNTVRKQVSSGKKGRRLNSLITRSEANETCGEGCGDSSSARCHRKATRHLK